MYDGIKWCIIIEWFSFVVVGGYGFFLRVWGVVLLKLFDVLVGDFVNFFGCDRFCFGCVYIDWGNCFCVYIVCSCFFYIFWIGMFCYFICWLVGVVGFFERECFCDDYVYGFDGCVDYFVLYWFDVLCFFYWF